MSFRSIGICLALVCAFAINGTTRPLSAQDAPAGEDEAGAEDEADADDEAGDDAAPAGEEAAETAEEPATEPGEDAAPAGPDADTAAADAAALAAERGTTISYTQAPPDPRDTYRLVLPPLLIERRAGVRTIAVFPLFYDRQTPHDHELLAGVYYQRRGRGGAADVVFPFFWSFRGATDNTWVVPPVYSHTSDDGFDFGIAPLVFTGRSGHKVYTVLPALLTVSWADDEAAHTFAGPFWRIRSGGNVDWGIFPLAWFFNSDTNFTGVIPPFFFRFENHEEQTATTVVPPVYHRTTPDSASWGLAGVLHHFHDADTTSLTIPPLIFHYSHTHDGDTRLVTPLGGYFDVDGSQTLITPLYQRHRGDTYLDSVAPFFFAWGDERAQSFNLLIPPLVFHRRTPGSSTTVVLPVYAHVGERGRFDTYLTPVFGHWESHTRDASGTWIFPTIQISHNETSSTFNIHPLVYATSGRTSRHLVVAPLVWDFEDYEAETRATVLFPVFWRFRTRHSVSQLALNTYWHESRSHGVTSWEFHFFPLFAFGSTGPGDHWWNVLYGLLGYKRAGSYARAQVFWAPIQVDGPDAREPVAPRPARVTTPDEPPSDGVGSEAGGSDESGSDGDADDDAEASDGE